MKVAVIGSRHAPASVSRRILEELPFNVSEIVSGGAEGVDRLAERVADILGIPVRVFQPDYQRYGRRAPLVRNEQIVEYADQVLAFWDGESRGTQSMIECAKDENIPCTVIRI